MSDAYYGRLTTLHRLKSVRDDPSKKKFHRQQAGKAMRKIVEQLKDKTLMRYREQLIKATVAGDLHVVWKLENRIRAYEGNYEGIEHHE